MTIRHCVAIDLGASSGRVMLARFVKEGQQLDLHELHRFSNQLVRIDGTETWDLVALEREILIGLEKACALGITIDSIGIDTWGADYVLLDQEGKVVGLPVSYRDHRTDGVMGIAHQDLGRDAIFHRTGIQFLPFNTLYQLRAQTEQQPQWSESVAHALLIPDYLYFRLTGQLHWEYTNATTTQLINLDSGDWDLELLTWAGIPKRWFGTPSEPGKLIGHWHNSAGQAIPVISVATHDTASAVLATPLMSHDVAYLSSGTWSLMGFESLKPYIGEHALRINVTNEGGVEGRYRVLKNIMGLWLLQRVCRELGITNLPELIARARQVTACRFLINPNDERFINPPNMCLAIQQSCQENGQPIPVQEEELARCIFDSLALLYAEILAELASLRGRPFTALHIVGGGCQNDFLNQLCADACGIPIYVGPIEASTLGNIGCQLMALNEVKDVTGFRQLIAQCQQQRHFHPQSQSDIGRHFKQHCHQAQLDKEYCS